MMFLTASNRTVFRLAGLAGIAVAASLLGGCVSRDFSDLEAYTQDVLSRPGGRIEPIPEIKPYEAYTYQSAEMGARDPFRLFYQREEEKVAETDAGLTPEMERELRFRNREELEQFELDSLRMVGTLQDPEQTWAIIRDPGGIVHRVREGNYMGRNVGKITNIYDDRVELREIYQDGQGRWQERAASIALAE